MTSAGQLDVDFRHMPSRLPKLPDAVRGRDYIETRDWSDEELELLLTTSAGLKAAFKADTGPFTRRPGPMPKASCCISAKTSDGITRWTS